MFQKHTRWSKLGAMGIALVGVFVLMPLSASATTLPVNLRSAAPFAVLAGAGVTNAGASTIVGDVGSYPTGTLTGFGACPTTNCVNLTGNKHVGAPTAAAA